MCVKGYLLPASSCTKDTVLPLAIFIQLQSDPKVWNSKGRASEYFNEFRAGLHLVE